MTDSSSPNDRTVTIRAEPIELCQLLKFGGLVGSGGVAKQVIADGMVQLNGALETQKRKKVRSDDRVTYAGQTVVVQLAKQAGGIRAE